VTTQLFTGTVSVIHCATCSMAFGITVEFQRHRREDHAEFFCPMKHANVYYGETELEKTKRALAHAQQCSQSNREWAEREQRRKEEAQRKASAFKGQATRAKKRAAHGLCPCCNRSFAATRMAAHVRTKHPDFIGATQ